MSSWESLAYDFMNWLFKGFSKKWIFKLDYSRHNDYAPSSFSFMWKYIQHSKRSYWERFLIWDFKKWYGYEVFFDNTVKWKKIKVASINRYTNIEEHNGKKYKVKWIENVVVDTEWQYIEPSRDNLKKILKWFKK